MFIFYNDLRQNCLASTSACILIYKMMLIPHIQGDDEIWEIMELILSLFLFSSLFENEEGPGKWLVSFFWWGEGWAGFSCDMRTLSRGTWDLVGSSSLTRDRTWDPCTGSMESWPLDHQGSPDWCLLNLLNLRIQLHVVRGLSLSLFPSLSFSLLVEIIHWRNQVACPVEFSTILICVCCHNKVFQTGGLNNRDLFFRSWDQKFQIMLPAGLASGENSFRLVDSYLIVGHHVAFPLCVCAHQKQGRDHWCLFLL